MSEDKQNKKKGSEKESTISIAWLVAGVLALIIIIFGAVLGIKGDISLGNAKIVYSQGKIVTADEAKEKALDYINNTLLQSYQGEITAEITEVKDENGLYVLKLSIAGEEFDSYVTKDGSMLFPEAYELNGEEETADSNTNTATTQATTEIPKAEKATAYLFTMSYCPYGNQADDAMKPVAELLGDKAVIEPHYVIYNKDFGYEGSEYCLDDESKYCSMHGIQELNQDVRELCVYKYEPAKYWDFVDKANKNCTSANVDECWEEQATAAGVNVSQTKTCQADEATDLLATEVELNEKYGVTGSPTLVINETKFTGSRTAEGYKQGVCSGFETEPEECATELSGDAAAAAEGSCN